MGETVAETRPGQPEAADRAMTRSAARPAARWWGRGLGALAVVTVVLAVSSPAWAHAQLESTQPVQSSVLTTSPRQVVLHFGEPVEIDFGSMRVIGPNGARVDNGGTHHPNGDTHAVAISLPSHLPDGTFIVAWRVISADSHPVHGAFVFSVGTARGAAKANALATSLSHANGSTVVGTVYGVIRFATFAALLLLVGTALATRLVWPRGAHEPHLRRVVWTAWGVLVLCTVLGIAVQGVYAAALPLTSIVHATLFNEVLHTRFGEVALLRLVLLAAAVPVLLCLQGRWGATRARGAGAAVAGVVVGVGLLITPGLAGHASTGTEVVLGTVLDVVHLSAASLWLGGLAVLAVVLGPGARLDAGGLEADEAAGGGPDPVRADAVRVAPVRADDGQGEEGTADGGVRVALARVAVAPSAVDPVAVARSVSAWSLGAVCVIVVTGVVQAIRQVGSFSALFDTVYGRTLLVKIGLVITVIAVASGSRRILHGRIVPRAARDDSGGSPHRPALGRLRRTVLVEIGIIMAVLAVTALLVNAVPARQAANEPFIQTFNTLGVQVNAIIDPARAGPDNQFHFYVLGRNGQPQAIPELDAAMSLPGQGIGPLTIPLRVASPGHFLDDRVDIPLAGSWTLKLTVRTSPIDEQILYATVPVH
jgi:copper transport protein